MRKEFNFILLHVCIQLFQDCFLKKLFSPHRNVLAALLKIANPLFLNQTSLPLVSLLRITKEYIPPTSFPEASRSISKSILINLPYKFSKYSYFHISLKQTHPENFLVKNIAPWPLAHWSPFFPGSLVFPSQFTLASFSFYTQFNFASWFICWLPNLWFQSKHLFWAPDLCFLDARVWNQSQHKQNWIHCYLSSPKPVLSLEFSIITDVTTIHVVLKLKSVVIVASSLSHP